MNFLLLAILYNATQNYISTVGIDQFHEIAKISGSIIGISTLIFGIWRYIISPLLRNAKKFSETSAKINEIYSEVKPNHGGSIKDSINRIERRANTISNKLSLMQNVQHAFREDSNAAVFECTVDGHNMYVNRTYARWLGTTKEELMGLGWKNYLYGFAKRNEYESEWTQAFNEGRELDFPVALKGLHGYFYCDVKAYPITDGEGTVVKYVGVMHKVKDKKDLLYKTSTLNIFEEIGEDAAE